MHMRALTAIRTTRVALLGGILGLLLLTAGPALAAELEGFAGDIRLNQGHYYDYQPFVVKMALNHDNPQLGPVDARVYVALEYQGRILFYPSYTPWPTYLSRTFAPGYTEEVLLSAWLGNLTAGGTINWYLYVAEEGTGRTMLFRTNSMTLHPEADSDEILIYRGRFLRGSENPAGLTRIQDQEPLDVVEVGTYYIEETEVTNAMYNRFIEAEGYSAKWADCWSRAGWEWKEANGVWAPNQWGENAFHMGPGSPNYPVSGVSYYEAEAYARWAGKRLPTEAEWERAARGSLRPNVPVLSVLNYPAFPWGELMDCSRVHYWDCGARTKAPVKSYPLGQSYHGLYDVAGNVWEWAFDYYMPVYYNTANERGTPSVGGSPYGPSKPRINLDGHWGHTWRGGSFWFTSGYYPVECANRYNAAANNRYLYVGFRCARDAQGTPPMPLDQ
jgi:formylglycine-generating enzyme required for sulfatase activity